MPVKVNPKWFCSVCGEQKDYPMNEVGQGLLALHTKMCAEKENPHSRVALISGGIRW